MQLSNKTKYLFRPHSPFTILSFSCARWSPSTPHPPHTSTKSPDRIENLIMNTMIIVITFLAFNIHHSASAIQVCSNIFDHFLHFTFFRYISFCFSFTTCSLSSFAYINIVRNEIALRMVHCVRVVFFLLQSLFKKKPILKFAFEIMKDLQNERANNGSSSACNM